MKAASGTRATVHRRTLVCILVAGLAPFGPGGLLAQGAASSPGSPSGDAGPYGPDVPPLFAAESPLELRIEADFRQIRRDRSDENPERPGVVYVLRADGSEAVWPVQIRTRGNFRLQSNTCDFPPIRLNFATPEVEGGVFEGQDKVKLVTHCRDRYEPNVLREYLAYRIYNTLTSASFRVRLARVAYHDVSGRDDPMTRLAFFIEMEKSLGERLNGRVLEDEELADGLHPGRVSAEDAVRVDLFQYMVGNTDYTMYFPADAGGLHNIVAVEGENRRVTPVPYDFDWTGVVDARYARPDPELGIRRVTDRLYRGFCRANIDYDAAYATFLDRRPEIDGMIAGFDLMEEDERRSVLEFVEEFWETVGDDRDAQRNIEEACRPY